ncbi:DUF2878 domain-containing protein [Salinivibrio sp. AR640]|uniref:DUF2878 domain-containing protein n=1 Tax=Salinivibrio sp. AR640 TaxID=1909437 RepID=UPI0009852CBF|nr:DUF2878 domain-containing protein [Salinivibrio sp. AR640]OOE90022.1 hypothetical protein BZG75_12310 [Salinivibrio sp. AR640]
MRFVLISLLFNVYWFSAAIGPPSLQWLMGAMLLAAIAYDRTVIAGILTLAPLGIIGDSVMLYTQWLAVDISSLIMPSWLILLWLGFCAFAWLMRELVLARPIWLITCIGSVGGASSYLAGERLGALSFPQSFWITGVVLLGVWAIYSVLFVALMRWLQHKVEARMAATRGQQ